MVIPDYRTPPYPPVTQLDVRDLVPQTRKPGVSHAVTVSTGIRISELGWDDMKPGIDGV
jgi:hypothetical protein